MCDGAASLLQPTSFLSHGNCALCFDAVRYSSELLPSAAVALANTGLPEVPNPKPLRVPDQSFSHDDGTGAAWCRGWAGRCLRAW